MEYFTPNPIHLDASALRADISPRVCAAVEVPVEIQQTIYYNIIYIIYIIYHTQLWRHFLLKQTKNPQLWRHFLLKHEIPTVSYMSKTQDKMKYDQFPVTEYSCTKFEQIHVMSDLHADYELVFRHLIRFGIMKCTHKNWYKDILNKNKANKVLGSVQWGLGPNNLLVICGDIVDGKRGDTQVPKCDLNVEVMLHILLRNLKILAKEVGSDVILLYGNHDFMCLSADDDSYEHYCHLNYNGMGLDDKDVLYDYSDINNRYHMLKPFYKNYSLYFGILKENVKIGKDYEIDDYELLFSHAGFFFDNSLMFKKTKQLQKDLQTAYDKQHVNAFAINIPKNDSREGKDGPYEGSNRNNMPTVVWTRDSIKNTSTNDEKFCDKHLEKPTMIVGHCQCDSHKYAQPRTTNRPCSAIIEHGSTPLCIYPKCFNNGIPKLINIDTSLSRAFSVESETKYEKKYEMLVISSSKPADGSSKNANKFDTFKSKFIKHGIFTTQKIYNEDKIGTYNLIDVNLQESTSGGNKHNYTKKRTKVKSKKSKKMHKKRRRNSRRKG